jgi:hypothetical protein
VNKISIRVQLLPTCFLSRIFRHKVYHAVCEVYFGFNRSKRVEDEVELVREVKKNYDDSDDGVNLIGLAYRRNKDAFNSVLNFH